MSDILETMREYKEYAETKSEREAFAAVIDELIRLRAENAKLSARSVLFPEPVQKIIEDYPDVCAERDMMREALNKIAERHIPDQPASDGKDESDYVRAHYAELRLIAKRAAIEGVTEPESPWRDIESAPRDGTPILCVKKGSGFQPEILGFEGGVFGWLNEDMSFSYNPYNQPTHWMHLPIPPR